MNVSSVKRALSTVLHHQAASASRLSIVASTLAVAVALVAAPAAKADTYSFSVSGGTMTANGIITFDRTTPVPGVPGGYQVTGITGTFSDSSVGLSNAAITGLQSIGLPNVDPIDGTFIPPGRQVDGYPFSFDNIFFPDGNSPAVCPPPPPGDPNGPWPFGGGFFDIYGLYFYVDGGYSVDIWSNGFVPPLGGLTYGIGDALNGEKIQSFGEPFNPEGAYATVQIQATPEPGSLLLIGTGALGFAGSLARRLRKAA
jgi:hypothetical protein